MIVPFQLEFVKAQPNIFRKINRNGFLALFIDYRCFTYIKKQRRSENISYSQANLVKHLVVKAEYSQTRGCEFKSC